MLSSQILLLRSHLCCFPVALFFSLRRVTRPCRLQLLRCLLLPTTCGSCEVRFTSSNSRLMTRLFTVIVCCFSHYCCCRTVRCLSTACAGIAIYGFLFPVCRVLDGAAAVGHNCYSFACLLFASPIIVVVVP